MTGPVSSRETGIRVAVRCTSDISDFVDQLGKDEVGEIVVRGPSREVRGVVFVETGRVCWAAARGLARRLTELLIARSPGMDAQKMEDLFRQCQEEGVPLGEFLVARGIVEPRDLRAVLFEHTAESIDALCTPDAEAGWCLRRGPGYSPQFTFATTELLARTAHRALSASERILTSEVAAILPTEFTDGEWAAAFIRGSGAVPSPVVVHGDLPDATSDVLRVGKWAASALDLAGTFQDGNDALVSVDDGTQMSVFVAWWHESGGERAIIAGRMRPQGPARILNRRARERRSSG